MIATVIGGVTACSETREELYRLLAPRWHQHTPNSVA